MRKIGFGFTSKTIKGHDYLYVFHYKDGRQKWKCAGNDRGMTLRMLRKFADEARRDALAFVDETLRRYEKELA